jgi:hypothetical protein
MANCKVVGALSAEKQFNVTTASLFAKKRRKEAGVEVEH